VSGAVQRYCALCLLVSSPYCTSWVKLLECQNRSGRVQVSFHKYGDFFPGTGSLEDVGHAGGIHYSVNVPLNEGMDDASYRFVYEPIMAEARSFCGLCIVLVAQALIWAYSRS
jgi:Histone deacetylase domain